MEFECQDRNTVSEFQVSVFVVSLMSLCFICGNLRYATNRWDEYHFKFLESMLSVYSWT